MSDRVQEKIDDLLGTEAGDWIECWQCGGEGRLPGCFEDTCVCGGDADVDLCCSPRRCDICRGLGGWKPNREGQA
jgi:hypothetical protein